VFNTSNNILFKIIFVLQLSSKRSQSTTIILSRNTELPQFKQPLRLTKDSNEQDLKSIPREVKSVGDGRTRVETIFARFILALGESAILGDGPGSLKRGHHHACLRRNHREIPMGPRRPWPLDNEQFAHHFSAFCMLPHTRTRANSTHMRLPEGTPYVR